MKRFIWTFALAAAPARLLAQAAVTDRLSLDLYLEYDCVRSADLGAGAPIIYTRGRVEKQNDRRETPLWVMNLEAVATADTPWHHTL